MKPLSYFTIAQLLIYSEEAKYPSLLVGVIHFSNFLNFKITDRLLRDKEFDLEVSGVSVSVLCEFEF